MKWNLFTCLCLGVTMWGCGVLGGDSHLDNLRYESLGRSMHGFALQVRAINREREDLIVRDIYDQMLRGDQRNTLLKNEIEETQKRVKSQLALLTEAETKLLGFAQQDPATGELYEPDETGKTQELMLGKNPEINDGRGGGMAREIRDSMTVFTAWANGMVKRTNADRGYSSEMEMLQNPISDRNPFSQRWEFYTFGDATAVAAYAEVTRLQMDLAVMEGILLDHFRALTRSNWGRETQLKLMESAERRVLKPGEEFVAHYHLADIYSLGTPVLETQGKASILEDGTIEVRWMAQKTAETNDNGLGVQSYQLIAKVPTADGSQREVMHQGEFYVEQ